MPSERINKIPLELAQTDLPRLHRQVSRYLARVEIDCPESGQTCVLMSKTELQSLEEALGIYRNSASSGQDMHDELMSVLDDMAAAEAAQTAAANRSPVPALRA